MNSNDYWGLICICAFAFCTIGFLIFILVNLILNGKVSKNSTALPLIKVLNTSYSGKFFSVQSVFKFTKSQKNKTAFDRTDFQKIFEEYYLANEEFFKQLTEQINSNIYIYSEYCSKFNDIVVSRSTDWYGSSDYEKRELKILNKSKLQPTVNVSITIGSEYTSPKGKNSYYNQEIFDYTHLKSVQKNISLKTEYQKSKQYQRSLMTDSLRYEILKRDGFKCVLCGCSAKDGAKLHVDHIIPISKGGKTVPSNLRTLCDQCNWGKGDKFEPSGLN